MKLFVVLLLLSLTAACRAAPQPPEPENAATAQATVVPAVAATYFAAVGAHEGSHALVLSLYGARDIKVDVLPNGHHLGETSARLDRPLRSTPQAWVDVAGPGMNFATGILARETLKSGYVPIVLQPAVQWLAVISKGIFYSELALGRVSSQSDFGKQPAWISGVFLLGGLISDFWDVIWCDSVKRYFGSLLGLAFYPERAGAGLAVPYAWLSDDGLEWGVYCVF